MISEERKKALDIAMAQIEKNFGKGAVMKLGEVGDVSIDTIPSGSLSLDIALGIGGFPRGRIVEIFGPESSGKTTVALHAIAEAQKLGGIAAFIDAEHALDPVYARNLGVDVDNLIVAQPDTGEQALEIAEQLVRSGAVDIITIDSVAALVPKAEIDGEMGDSHVGLQARLMSQALRKLTGVLNKSNTVAIFINQLREKVGVMFGNPETTALQNRDYFNNIGTEVSSHFVVGLEGEIIQCLPLNEVSAASNHRNIDTLSIEVCHPDESGKFNEATYNSLIKLLSWICRTLDLSAEDVIRHYDITGKLCPLYYVENPQEWKSFIVDLESAISAG